MSTTVKVRVLDGWAVYDGERQRGAGEVLDVDTDTVDQWEVAGWVERVKTSTRKK